MLRCALKSIMAYNRVAKELEAIREVADPVLILNCCNLRGVPEVLLCDDHCKRRLKRLYLKRNLIQSVVGCRKRVGLDYWGGQSW